LIKNGPESAMSFHEGNYESVAGMFTGITGHDEAMAILIRRDVSRLLDRASLSVDEEASKAIESHIGLCEGTKKANVYILASSFILANPYIPDWTSIRLLPKVVQIVIMLSQCMFVGEPLRRDDKWVRRSSSPSRDIPQANSSTRSLWLPLGLSAVLRLCGSTVGLCGLLWPGAFLRYETCENNEWKPRSKNLTETNKAIRKS